MIHLIASANAAYAERIRGWLDHATAYAERVTLACVGPTDDEPWVSDLALAYPSASFLSIAHGELAFEPPLDHLQAGGFLWPVFADDDLIIFTDGDALL